MARPLAVDMTTQQHLGLAMLVLFALATPALAHDGWLEAHPVVVERGQPVSVFLMFGNHGNDRRSCRLAGKWRPEYSTVIVSGPSGLPVNLTDQMMDFGHAEDVGPKGPKGFHLAAFTPTQEGAYIALATQTRELRFDGHKFQSIATAKVVFGALARPVVAGARLLTGFDRKVGGAEALEIVPVTNPLAVRSGDSLMLEVRYRGRPAPGQTISVIRRLAGPPSDQTLTTDGHGQVKIVDRPCGLLPHESLAGGTDGFGQ